jgi:katanin p60 ATPase-containing subunit A1
MAHMISLGYIDSSERLAQEAGMATDRYELCDNINLMQIITDFEAFQKLKYGQKPKLTRPAQKSQTPMRKPSNPLPLSRRRTAAPRRARKQQSRGEFRPTKLRRPRRRQSAKSTCRWTSG